MPTDQLRFSRRVPDSGVNLAWVRLPALSPLANMSLVDTSQYIAENIPLGTKVALASGVVGIFTTTATVTGNVYLTTYNAVPTGTALSSGFASYTQPRGATTAVLPSGFVLQNFTSPIQVLHPNEDPTGVWRLRVQDGVIGRRYVLPTSDQSWLSKVFAAGEELFLYYSVVAAQQIPYLPDGGTYEDARVLDVSGRAVEILDEHTLQLPAPDLFEVRSLKVNGQELITSPSGQLQLATAATAGNLPPAGPFTAWDPAAGQLTLSRSLDPRDDVTASFRYRDYRLTYEGYLDDSNVYHDLNLNPAPGHTYDNGRPTAELPNIPIYVYLLPTAAYRTTDVNGAPVQDRKIYSGVRFTNSFLRWERTPNSSAPTRNTFGHNYYGSATFVSTLPIDTTSSSSTTGQVLANFPCAVVLAKLYVVAAAGIESTELTDTRVRGGGIPTGIDPARAALPGASRREVETYWDQAGWDGQPVPLAGTLLVELPGGLLTGVGYPQFTHDEIQALVQKHVAAGIRVVIRYL